MSCEPLHDVKGHISNLYDVLVNHVTAEEKKLLKETIEASFENKECKRGVDYRKSLIKIVSALDGKIDSIVHLILSTMCEIQELLYTSETNRTIEKILRLHNQCFLHMILLNKVVGLKTSPLTVRCFYGKYYHSLMAHSALMFRMISGLAANTEEEERTFNTMKTITNATSNFHPDHVILNNIIRVQFKEKFNSEYSSYTNQNEVSKLTKSLPPKKESFFPFWIIRKESRAWQAHLESISDYLSEENQWWSENTKGITFHDIHPNKISKLKPKHFRSTTLKEIKSLLQNKWEYCLQNNSLIPAQKIIHENVDNEVITTTLSTLNNAIIHTTVNEIQTDNEIIIPANSDSCECQIESNHKEISSTKRSEEYIYT